MYIRYDWKQEGGEILIRNLKFSCEYKLMLSYSINGITRDIILPNNYRCCTTL